MRDTLPRRLHVNKSCIEILEITVKASASCVVLLKGYQIYILRVFTCKVSFVTVYYRYSHDVNPFMILLALRESI